MSNNKEALITPLEYHGPGACPNCFRPMVLADMEINMIDLDKNGQAISITDTMVSCKAICWSCRLEQKMMRSNGIYRPYSEVVQIFDRLDFEDKVNRRNEGRYSIDENPLSLDD